MGHRFSKTAANNIAATTAKTITTTTPKISSEQHQQQEAFTTTNRISIPNGNNHFVGPTINLQIQESPQQEQQQFATCNTTTTAAILQHQQQQSCSTASISSSLTSVNNLSCGGRQIIIKIQLAKMENGNETSTLQQQHQDTSLESLTADCNLNSTELSTTTATTAAAAVGAQILNLTLNSSNSMSNPVTTSSSSLSRTAGSSLTKNNNYLNSNTGAAVSCSSTSSSLTTTSNNERLGRFNNTLQFNDEIVEQNIGEIVEYCEVLEEQTQPSSSRSNNNHMQISNNGEQDNETNVCCRRKSKSLAANGGSMSSSNNNNNSTGGAKTKSRCRKCSCRDAFRRILDPSLSRSSNKANKQQQQKEQKRPKSQDRHSNNLLNNNRSLQRHTMHSTTMTNPPTTSAMLQQPPRALATSASSAAAATSAQQVSLWAPHTANVGDVIIPLTTPQQFVVVQCAIVNPANAPHLSNALNSTSSTSSLPNSIVSLSNDMSSSSNTSSSNDIMVKVPSSSRTPGSNTNATIMGPIVHSQVDFVHYLVPDLERITNSSFYWGKMDRYEAERLLEGKPEGTFLLRDSAQEEFLFSVTFRKYGRSLHARIEQSGHRFSFDCHDPCVFTASTVAGLLEHYKDPACVMFFEPMLTIPLHRKNCFSLQKLCRATIVSNTTYDGINELELPARLKSYLKEYHYKQKLRVKSNEPTYTIHCK